MIDTLAAMTPALIVLFILGSATLGLGWWLSVKSENRDAWLFGEDQAIVESLRRQSEFYAANPRVDAQPEDDDQ